MFTNKEVNYIIELLQQSYDSAQDVLYCDWINKAELREEMDMIESIVSKLSQMETKED